MPAVRKSFSGSIPSRRFNIFLKRYPEQSSLLDDPKVTLHVDDGRRWLNRNPEAKFDLILQNTTFYWRSHITNLVSVEYLQLCKRHLKPGGVMYYNSTSNEDIHYTAARVFKYVAKYGNFVAASDSRFILSQAQIRENLLKFEDSGGRIFERPGSGDLLNAMSRSLMLNVAPELRKRNDLLLITDDNMVTEYKNIRWLSWRQIWGALMHRAKWVEDE